jgi:uncharacterized protein
MQGSIPSRRSIGRVSRIAIYPVKGCAGVELQRARVGRTGLEGDREYMVVREGAGADGALPFITQRDKRSREDAKPQTLSALALIRPETRDGVLRLTWEGSDPIAISHEPRAGDVTRVRIHNDLVSAVDQGEEVAGWLSDRLELKVRLVRASGPFHRLAKQNYMRNTNQITFQDAYPIHWLMQESVDELSERAGQEIPWTRFRPNVVGEGGEPRAEHEIHEGRIGGIGFVQPKPCTRCPVTTVDQELGEKRGNEPLVTLSRYKRWGRTGEVLFGENALPLEEGWVGVGDEIVQVSARSPPLFYGG